MYATAGAATGNALTAHHPIAVPAAQAQAAYELATSAFSYGKQRLVCDGFTRKCRALGEGSRQLGRKAG